MASTTAPSSKPKFFATQQPPRRCLQSRATVVAAVRRRRPWNYPPTLVHVRRCRATGDGGAADVGPRSPTSTPGIDTSNSVANSQDGYLSLFVRMLGLDHDLLDREQAIATLWKYSEGGKTCIDGIMQFPGCINLVVSLLRSESSSACEAAAGLLRNISSINSYKDIIAESGAIEEIARLLCQSNLTSEAKEQSLCILWNLSIDEKLRIKIANSYFLPLLVKYLDDEEIKVKEAAGGVLANLALSPCNHSMLVEAGVIPKLADLLKSNIDGYKVIRKEAKSALLQLAEDEYYKILIIEEGLVRVPVIGATAFKSYRPPTYSWPTLPDGIELQRSSRPSRYGASDLLLGLNIPEKNFTLEEAKMNAIVGRSQQQFLARIGAIALQDGAKPLMDSSSNQQYTLLPWLDGIARLVLILGLEDVSAITRAAHSVADASTSEHMRISFKEAGAVKSLVQLLNHNNKDVKLAVTCALERLSVSHKVCQAIEAEGGLTPLIDIIKQTNDLEDLLEKALSILSRILDPTKEMETKFHDKIVNGSDKMVDASDSSQELGSLRKPKDTVLMTVVVTREKAIDADFLSCLIEFLRSSPPNLQVKVASILEYAVMFESHAVTSMSCGIESGLEAVFRQQNLEGTDVNDDYQPELSVTETEEISLVIAAASRLFIKLLQFKQFCSSINSTNFVVLLRKILKSDISLRAKNWVAACLVNLESQIGSSVDFGYPTEVEVALYETIPRLVEKMRMSFSYEEQAAAAIELNEILSRGVVVFSRAVAAAGGIFPLVKLIEAGSGDALEASLAILYNLSMDSENHSAIIAAGAVPVLKRIVLAGGQQWQIALHVLRTLPTLSSSL